MGKSQRSKGQRGERELAAKLRDLTGFSWKRGYQVRGGGKEAPDVLAEEVPGLHVEAKIGKSPRLWGALKQAKADCGERLPCVIARRDRERWVVLVELDRLQELADLLWP